MTLKRQANRLHKLGSDEGPVEGEAHVDIVELRQDGAAAPPQQQPQQADIAHEAAEAVEEHHRGKRGCRSWRLLLS